MRLLKSTPKDRAFYNEHGGNLSAYYTIANIGQLLSAGSLALAVFTLLSDAIKGRGMSTSTAGVVVAAVLIGVFIELANRKLARPAIRPWVVKDQFADDADKRKRHNLLTKFSRAGLVTVGLLSFGLSFMGSLDAGQLITDDAPPANIDSLQIAFAADTSALLAPILSAPVLLLMGSPPPVPIGKRSPRTSPVAPARVTGGARKGKGLYLQK